MNKRLTVIEARVKIRACLDNDSVTFRSHAVERMFERKVPLAQVIQILRAGAVFGPELVGDEWRHTVSAQKVSVVVAIYENTAVVTVMRTGR